MSKNHIKIQYDRESRVLSVELEKKKSVDSNIHGNVVIDYDKQGKIVRINLYEFNFGQFKSNVKSLRAFARHSGVELARVR